MEEKVCSLCKNDLTNGATMEQIQLCMKCFRNPVLIDNFSEYEGQRD